jgi:hypothetical protein
MTGNLSFIDSLGGTVTVYENGTVPATLTLGTSTVTVGNYTLTTDGGGNLGVYSGTIEVAYISTVGVQTMNAPLQINTSATINALQFTGVASDIESAGGGYGLFLGTGANAGVYLGYSSGTFGVQVVTPLMVQAYATNWVTAGRPQRAYYLSGDANFSVVANGGDIGPSINSLSALRINPSGGTYLDGSVILEGNSPIVHTGANPLFTRIGNIPIQGLGAPIIYSAGTIGPSTVSTATTVTVGTFVLASAGVCEVSGFLLVNSYSSGTIQVNVLYKDIGGTARNQIIPLNTNAQNGANNLSSAIQGAGQVETIACSAGTVTVQVQTTGASVSMNYTAVGIIKQVA